MTELEKLPPWVWTLVAAVLKYEDEHGSDWPCLAAVADTIPADVQAAAEALRTAPLEALVLVRAEELRQAAKEKRFSDTVGEALRWLYRDKTPAAEPTEEVADDA